MSSATETPIVRPQLEVPGVALPIKRTLNLTDPLTMAPPMPSSAKNSNWTSRPILGRLLQISLFVVPFALAFFVSLAIAEGLPAAETRAGQGATIFLLLFVALVVMVSAERLARIAAPITVLLGMTMLFPDRAPNRVRLAMRCSSTDELRRTLIEVNESGLGGSANEAAETLMVLVAALSRHDRMTRGHSERVRAYADVIAGEMGLCSEDRSKLRWAALLHDIGKMQIPSQILNKPGRLTDVEYEIVKQHAAIGGDLVEPLRDFLGPWADTVAQHHERWDGAGYPNGLAGTEICLGARIVAVADTFDVITSLRSYKDPLPAAQARVEIARCAGTQFDADVVKSFLQIGISRFRWRLAPLSVLTQIPQLVAVMSPVAGGVTTVAATTAPVLMAGAATMGMIAATEPMAPMELPAADEYAIVAALRNSEPSTTVAGSEVTVTSLEVTTTMQLWTTTTPTRGDETATPPSTLGTLLTVTTTEPVSTVLRSSTTAAPATTASTSQRPATTTVTTAPAGPNPPDGLLPGSIRTCLGYPDLTASQFRNAGWVNLSGCDLTGVNLAGFDLSGSDIRYGSLAGASFDGTDLSDA
ncbi:MAG: HD domain-containing protein, partial [Acidimicrobiales bacterium]|nr:HD domain-containing protein [Acidimicrobiales bacterium]